MRYAAVDLTTGKLCVNDDKLIIVPESLTFGVNWTGCTFSHQALLGSYPGTMRTWEYSIAWPWTGVPYHWDNPAPISLQLDRKATWKGGVNPGGDNPYVAGTDGFTPSNYYGTQYAVVRTLGAKSWESGWNDFIRVRLQCLVVPPSGYYIQTMTGQLWFSDIRTDSFSAAPITYNISASRMQTLALQIANRFVTLYATAGQPAITSLDTFVCTDIGIAISKP